MFKRPLLITLSLAIFLTCPSPVKAQSSSTLLESQTPQQSQTKRELIDQLLEVTKAKKLWEQMLEANFTQIEQNFSTLLPQISSSSGELSTTDQQNLESLQAKSSQILAKFQMRLQETLTFEEIVEKIYYPLYDKYFTEQDLRDIVAFYQTPVGQRTIEVMPKLATESLEKVNQLMLPKILSILQEVIAEEMHSEEIKDK